MYNLRIGNTVREVLSNYAYGPLMRIVDFAASGTLAICRTVTGNITRCVLVTLLILVPLEMNHGFMHGQALDDFPSHPVTEQPHNAFTAMTSGTTTTTTAAPRMSG
jgi:hypothetical protein